MKVVSPTAMMRHAADAISPVRDVVAVFGAVGVQVVLADSVSVLTPTLDIDFCFVNRGTLDAEIREVIRALERVPMTPSERPGERGFTWETEFVKVQLVRGFAPFPRGATARLPEQAGIEEFFELREAVAFDDDPERIQFWCADPASLLGLKRRAFGRKSHDGTPIVRDYVDAYLLMDHAGDEIAGLYPKLTVAVRAECDFAVATLADPGSTAVRAAAIELASSGVAASVEVATADVRRAATRLGEALRRG